MDYKKVLEELYGLDIKKWILGLDRMEALLEKLGHPEKRLRCIHVAGTNGKGSVCAMISSILKEAGYKAGMYTSPHLKRFNERIGINGKLIKDKDIVKYYLMAKRHVNGQSFFEITTAMAFLYFAEKKADFAVLEVGLGGRLDATNVVMPLVSVITNIGLEHTRFLGSTIEKIAYEKAGIIKKNIPAVTAAEGIALATIKKVSDERNSKLHIAPKEGLKYRLGLKGEFQKQNASIAIKAIETLQNNYSLKISENSIKNGLLNAKWPGRFQFLEKNVLVDCAHNPHGFRVLSNELKNLNYKKLIVILGFSDDKDVGSISKIIAPMASKIILAKSSNERAAEPETIKKYFNKIIIVIKNPKKALNYAKKIAKKEDLILVAGSIFLVGEVI